MASPQLQMAIDAMKGMQAKQPKTPQEFRAVFEEMAAPAEADIKSERVSAGGVNAEWVSAPNAA
jgi:hypothetical protein